MNDEPKTPGQGTSAEEQKKSGVDDLPQGAPTSTDEGKAQEGQDVRMQEEPATPERPN